MNNSEKVRNLELIYEVCCAEMTKLRASIATFLEESRKDYKLLCSQLESTVDGDMVTLITYDNYSTKLSTLTDMTRKFNLHMYFQELQQKEDIDNMCNRMNAFNCDSRAVEQPLFIYKKPSIDHFVENVEIDACVTYVDRMSLKFSICEIQNPLISALINLQQTLNGNYRKFDGMPDPSEVFGLVIDNQLFRAVRENTDDARESFLAYLLEFGEITQVNSHSEMFHLPQRYKDIPAQAVLCELVSVNGDTECDLREALLKYECTKAKFSLVRKDDTLLYMNLVEDEASEDQGTNPFKCPCPDDEEEAETTPVPATTPVDRNGLTTEDIKILYEEPLQTSNVMKAVLGYVPKDDSRICRYYNPAIKGCFKGTNCRMLHTERIKDGWTKDMELVRIDMCVPMVYPQDGSIIRVIPTHVISVCSFYAQLEVSDRHDNPLFWSSRDIPDKTRLKVAPMPFEMVLAQFSDGNWYRAQVLDVYEDDTFRVFYVDYGNEDMVPLSGLAAWNNDLSSYSFQAYRCRIAGIGTATKSREEDENALKLIGGMILDQLISIRVLCSSDELLVELVDKNCAKLPEILVWQRYAKEVDKIL